MTTTILILSLGLAALLGAACGWHLRGAAEAKRQVTWWANRERWRQIVEQSRAEARQQAEPRIFLNRSLGRIRHYRN